MPVEAAGAQTLQEWRPCLDEDVLLDIRAKRHQPRLASAGHRGNQKAFKCPEKRFRMTPPLKSSRHLSGSVPVCLQHGNKLPLRGQETTGRRKESAFSRAAPAEEGREPSCSHQTRRHKMETSGKI